jgi:protein-S-isoprenylcysteine O-methyltransferase Ste14
MTNKSNEFSKRRLFFTAISSGIFLTAVFFLAAGDLRWVEGWLFVIVMNVMVLSNLLYLYIKDPALLAERSKPVGSDNQKGWDKVLLSAAYALFMVWYVLMPFDAYRFGWSPAFSIWLKIIGGMLLIPSLYFIYQATAENTFMSTRVKIQTDRKQHVISSGVYGIVRHPLYLGALFMLVGAPLLLGSLIGLAISLIAMLTLVGRIHGEEKMLLEELDGYKEYTDKVNKKLIPFIW